MSDQITIEHNPSPMKLEVMHVDSWAIWSKEVSSFPWQYEQTETCYILEGEVIVTPNGSEPVTLKAKDLVTFPKGMSCHWQVIKPIKKHYQFSH